MLKIKVFRSFAALVLVLGLLSAFIGKQMIESRVVQEAQTRVKHDLDSARAVLDGRFGELETVLRLTAAKPSLVQACERRNWKGDVRNQLALVRASFNLDFLAFVAPDGKVKLRTAPPYNTGDFRLDRPSIAKAMHGNIVSGITLFSRAELQHEAEGLTDRAYITLQPTPRARPTPKSAEDRGMVLIVAVPVERTGSVLGVLYGGQLLNRNNALIDRIQNVVYRGETYNSSPTGTATIFLGDTRIATSVRLKNGNRAIGTRVSKEVADQVLDNGRPWIGRAFVVHDWYLTAYEPIRSPDNKIIGMLYVGILERPFRDLGGTIFIRYILLSVFGLAATLALAFFLAGRVVRPIEGLARAAEQLREGKAPTPVPLDDASNETQRLVVAFNHMAAALKEREDRLRQANQDLEQANEKLKTLNRSYMETVGFVAHEMKSPLATMMNYVYLLKEEKLGELLDKQKRAVENVDRNVKLLAEMIRHYLNLSRIENGELAPVPSRVAVLEDVLTPLLETFTGEAERQKMSIDNRIGAEAILYADVGMTREVFENLVSNAVKYGREGGTIRVSARDVGEFYEFSVWNEGEGIPKEKIPQLFQKFVRLQGQKAAHRQKGTGLGLFICRNIVEAHGGRIEALSEPEQWVEFRFTLPKYADPPKTAES